MKTIYVKTKQCNYPIVIGKNTLKHCGTYMKRLKLGRKVLIVSHRSVAKLYLTDLKASLEKSGFEVHSHLLPFGSERDKSEASVSGIWQKMASIPLERSSSLVALGGGVVGDVGAFAASTYMRGISLIQIPTTLLAQVDSAIGGKTAIDLPSAKNIVGTFHQPKMVLTDVNVLKSLPAKVLRDSMAEVVKCGMIKDSALFSLMEYGAAGVVERFEAGKLTAKDVNFLEQIIYRSARVKARVVARDEYETKGERIILNYGHTFAHAFEAASDFKLSHGSAVSLGMVLAARFAANTGRLSSRAEMRQLEVLKSIGLPVSWDKSKYSKTELLNYMKRDKKVRNGKLRFVLPKSIGHVEIKEGISEQAIKSLLDKV